MAIGSVIDDEAKDQAGIHLTNAAAVVELIAMHRPTNAEDTQTMARAAYVALDLIERAQKLIGED